MDASIVFVSNNSWHQLIAAQGVIVCAWKYKDSVRTGGRCATLWVWVFNETKRDQVANKLSKAQPLLNIDKEGKHTELQTQGVLRY